MESNNVKDGMEEGKPVARLQIYSSSATGVSPFWRGLFSLSYHSHQIILLSY